MCWPVVSRENQGLGENLFSTILPLFSQESEKVFPKLPAPTPNLVPLKIINKREKKQEQAALVSPGSSVGLELFVARSTWGPQDADDRFPVARPHLWATDRSFTLLTSREGPGSVPARVTQSRGISVTMLFWRASPSSSRYTVIHSSLSWGLSQ